MPPLQVDIIAYAPTQFYHCKHCEVIWNAAKMPGVQTWHADMLETSIPPEMMKDYRNLSDWIINAAERYGGRVIFKVVDATSLEGVVKSLRYGVRKYPAVVIEGNGKTVGDDFHQAETMIDQRLAHQAAKVSPNFG